MSSTGTLGRRPGESGTRAAILAAAREQFAALGYDRASVRVIAQAAGVDPALVLHFFGSKQRLFVVVAELPFDPVVVLPELLSGDRHEVGERLARFLVGVLNAEEGRRRVTGLIRAAASEKEAARLVRKLVERELFAPLTTALGADDAPLRASLIGAQVVGLVMARYIVAVESLASVDVETIVGALAPVFQHFATGALKTGSPPSSHAQ
ncbi:MAG: TetR family transcriptional regulator [Thermomicrobiales bacterium]